MKNTYSTPRLRASLIMILLLVAALPTSSYVIAEETNSQYSIKHIELIQTYSTPLLRDDTSFLDVIIPEADSFVQDPARPMLPVDIHVLELPWGSRITDISVTPSKPLKMSLTQKVKPAPLMQRMDRKWSSDAEVLDAEIYTDATPYPSDWYRYTTGVGVNEDASHVLYLSLHLYPVQYIPADDRIDYVQEMQISITYEEPITKADTLDIRYDLIIIAPAEYADDLEPLVSHKNSYGIQTMLVPLQDIYLDYPGRDQAEQIKYFIKYALEEWDISYVLLVGDITKLPIRTTWAFPWDGWGGNILSDLYYADIYDENFSYCSWDANNNSKFGEVEYTERYRIPFETGDLDAVDLYPDVGIGRLACTDTEEVQIVVNKIITYEQYTYDQTWFQKIILAGGDTFPLSKMSLPFVYEGEITNEKVMQQLPEFEPIKLWASKRNLNALTFNRAINKGAGFLTYAGHGFEHGWGTYRPNAIQNRMGFTHPLYYTPFIRFLHNQNKLPIIFFDACLTAKLDFNISDLTNYYPVFSKALVALRSVPDDPSVYYPCFAWSFLIEPDGGAIATIGATRPAYTLVDKDGVYAGAGYLDVHFFKAYEEGVTVSDMLTQTQTDYLNNVGRDYFTIEEFMLLGDPSLKVGGYP